MGLAFRGRKARKVRPGPPVLMVLTVLALMKSLFRTALLVMNLLGWIH
jgi:hypothetical protein